MSQATHTTIAPRIQARAMVTAGFGQNFVLTTVSTFILVYLLQYAGVSTGGLAAVTVIITVSKFVDAVLDPLMGSIVDMTRSRWGKLRPYILFSAAPVAVLSGLLFSVPDVEEPAKIAFFGVTYILWSLAYTVCDVPFWGLIGSAFVEPDRRNRVIGSVRAFGSIALGLSTLGMPWLAKLLSFGPETTGSGWTLAVFVTSFLGMGVFLLAFFFTRERETAAASDGLSVRQLFSTLFKNKALLTVLLASVLGFGRFIVQAGGALFVVIAYGDEGAFTLVGAAIIVGMVVSSFTSPLLLRRMSPRRVMVWSSFVAAALYLLMFVVGFANLAVLLVFIFLTGLMLGVFLVTQASMIADSVDDAERRLGVRNDGISFASLTFVSKIMNALAVLVFGVFVVIAGYERGVDVTPAMQQTVFLALTIVPAVSCVLSALPFLVGRRGPASAARSESPAA
ncbi:sugar (Glycoside-Pentoside-Hexuronide) transporter [Agromyces sp. CF514]|uniref:MFS transporter n=1 Tax=Agromyces sp. CF514 TaxID=1881031 RepID=UPI0008EC943A|nr:glycoside-pentoside-hexuronide (GPH):cation symporter [Agromyces sp. CF514]SFR67654.1 sugar (Glycoside-Pentoside-Hexuronide) transporter [Agromyces sp. CF514]